MQPYRLVKDHRTNEEASDVDSILDGNIEKMLRAYLLYIHHKNSSKI